MIEVSVGQFVLIAGVAFFAVLGIVRLGGKRE